MQQNVFSEQEVAEIIQRAAELSEEGVAASAYTPGITREELETIAREVGVTAGALDRAIQERLEAKPHPKKGIRFVEEFERVIDGELDPANFDVVLEDVKLLGTSGQAGATQVGRSLKASAWTGVSQAHIDVNSRNGRTKLKVRSNPLFQALMTLYPALIGSGILGGVLGEQGYVMAAALGACGLIAVGAAAFFKLLKVGHRRAGELANRLAGVIAKLTAEKGNPASGSTDSAERDVHKVGP